LHSSSVAQTAPFQSRTILRTVAPAARASYVIDMADSAHVVNVTAATFQKEVVERSRKTPVLIDFWAPWCGPCKQLTPLLEKLVAEGAGSWVLAKVNTDKETELAQAFQIQGIPAVMAVKDGRIVDGLQGALPERDLRKFLDNLIGKQMDPLAIAREMAAEGELEQALGLLREILVEMPEHHEARVLLGTLLCNAGRTAEAQAVYDKLPEDARAKEPAQALAAQLALTRQASELDSAAAAILKNPNDIAARIQHARSLIGAKREEEGLGALLELVKSHPSFDGGAAKKAMLEAFGALGADHPLTVKYRYQLQMVLLV
jgi:putative thioredoxin